MCKNSALYSRASKWCPFSKRAPFFIFFCNKSSAPFQPFCGKWCPKSIVLENGALLGGHLAIRVLFWCIFTENGTIFQNGSQRALFFLSDFLIIMIANLTSIYDIVTVCPSYVNCVYLRHRMQQIDPKGSLVQCKFFFLFIFF